MKSENITKYLEQAIDSLIENGKEPTVATIKSKLSVSVPIPVIVTVIQAWKKKGKLPNIEKNTRTPTQEARIQTLEDDVRFLKEKVALLEKQLANHNKALTNE